MVNASPAPESADRRQRPRGAAAHAPVLGAATLNPFGDLHTLQHLSARLARSLRPIFEPLLRQPVRAFAEPLSVERFGDYVRERPAGLTAWQPLAMSSGDGRAVLVIEGGFVLRLLDLFFGGSGQAPAVMPTEFTPAAEALVSRLAGALAQPLASAWEPVAKLDFHPGHVEAAPALLTDLDGEDAMIVTRFGLAAGVEKPVFVDILYPVAALKPLAPQLTAKVHGRSAQPAPGWRTALTRATMNVTLPVRSVLAEPVLPLGRLLELKEGDVIPVAFGPQVPVMVGGHRLAVGTVGTSNGRAAIRIDRLEALEEDQ
jgi:flagellar motor switch protein FliM